jgi:hypothetical protein
MDLLVNFSFSSMGMYGLVEDAIAITPYSPFPALIESCLSRISGKFALADKVPAMFSPYLPPLM